MSLQNWDSSENLISVFVESLSDPLNPKYCCKFYNCLLFFLNHTDVLTDTLSFIWVDLRITQTLILDRPEFHCHYLMSHFPELFKALMSFLTVDRSREDMRKLKDRMESCTCDQADPVVKLLHSFKLLDNVAPPIDSLVDTLTVDTLKSLVRSMATLLRLPVLMCPNDLKEIKKVRRAKARGKEVRWPMSPQDILDGDVQSRMTMLCRWLDEYTAMPMLHLIQAIGFKCGRDVVISLLLSATLAKNLVDLTEASLRQMLAQKTAVSPDQLKNHPFKWCLGMMITLERSRGAIPLAWFYNDQAARLLEIFTQTAKFGDRIKKESKKKVSSGTKRLQWDYSYWEIVINSTGGELHSQLNLPHDKTKYHPMLLAASDAFTFKKMDPWQSACDNMLQVVYMSRCAYPLCTENFLGSGRKFQYCGGCRRTPYCSVEHQRSDVSCF